MLRSIAVSTSVVLVGCGATEPFEELVLSTVMEPAAVSAGDSVRFTAEAFNPTDERVQVGRECGPAMDVVVTTPEGTTISTLLEMVGNGAFTCELGPHHFADPGETERVVTRWQVPAVSGEYEAVTVLRRPEFVRSAPLRFTVP
jgi:hypothetical protein